MISRDFHFNTGKPRREKKESENKCTNYIEKEIGEQFRLKNSDHKMYLATK